MINAKRKTGYAAKSITVLGSTGSIGTQALEVAEDLGLEVFALAAHSDIKTLESQIRKFKPKYAAVYHEGAAADLKIKVSDMPVKVLSGMDGLCEAASYKVDMLLNAVVGMVGLEPTLIAARAGNNIALANKETLVAGGQLVMDTTLESGVNLLPVDSEHSAIFQCLVGAVDEEYHRYRLIGDRVKRIILTASGGPFFGKTTRELEGVTVEQALKHPNWDMGAKISIDSATLMNKGLEVIEAYWLFGVPVSNIDVVVHRESIIHSMIEYVDGSVIAQMGLPDMKLPIQYAFTYPERESILGGGNLNLWEIGKLSFFKPDYETFRCLGLCVEALKKGGLYPAMVNAANEEAVKLFLDRKIGFMDIPRLVGEALNMKAPEVSGNSSNVLNQILDIDKTVREAVAYLV